MYKLILTAGLALSLAACKKSETNSNNNSTDSTQRDAKEQKLEWQNYSNAFFEMKVPASLPQEKAVTEKDLEAVRCQGCYTGLEGFVDFNNADKTVYFAAYLDGVNFSECTIPTTSEEYKVTLLDSVRTDNETTYSYKTFDTNLKNGEKDLSKPIIIHAKHVKTKSNGAVSLAISYPEPEKDKWIQYVTETLQSFKSKK